MSQTLSHTAKPARSGMMATDDAVYAKWGRNSDVMLFSFGGMPLAATDWIPFQYVKATAEFDIDKVYLRDPNRSWYHFGVHPHTAAVDDTAAYLLDLVIERGAKRVVMIGSSAGGYAAMLHGYLIGADEVHAFAPQTYIDVDNRIRNEDFFMDEHLGPLYETPGVQREYFDLRPLFESGANTKTNFYIHYNKKHRIDDVNANHLNGLPNVFRQEYADGGHNIAGYLRKSGLLHRILKNSIENKTRRASFLEEENK